MTVAIGGDHLGNRSVVGQNAHTEQKRRLTASSSSRGPSWTTNLWNFHQAQAGWCHFTRLKAEDRGEYSVCVYMGLTVRRNPATARWVVGDILYSRGSSEDRGPATGSRGTTPRQPLRRKPNASNLRRSPTPSSSQQSSYSSQYSEAQVPMTAIRKPITASPRRSGSLEQPEPLAVSQSSLSSPNTGVIKKSVSFKLPEPQTTKGTPWGGSPRTGAESAAGAAYRRYGKPPPPFNPTTSCTSGFWRSASRKTASTNKRQISFRSRIFPASNTSSNPPQFRAHQWFRQSTAVASRQTDTQQGSAAKAETSKAGRGQRRDRTGYMEARTIRGRQGQQGRHLRAKTLRKGSRRRFWR